MEVDIYITSLKTAIEYDGAYWHNRKEKSKQREIIKYQKCQQHGIRLIRLRESISNTEHEIADICFHVENVDNINNLNMLIRHLLDEIDLRSNMWTRKNPRMVHSPINVDADRDRFEILKYKQILNKNSLKELYPELAEEWNYEKNGNFTPDKVTPGSDKRVWWKCKYCGYEWETTVGHRVNGTGCPSCVLRRNKNNHYLARKIYQYSLDGVFIGEWNSLSAASRELKINDSNISMCAKGKRKSAGGFIWKYEKD
jgi:rubrerythrin